MLSKIDFSSILCVGVFCLPACLRTMNAVLLEARRRFGSPGTCITHGCVYHPGVLHVDLCTVMGAGKGTRVIWKGGKYSVMKPSL